MSPRGWLLGLVVLGCAPIGLARGDAYAFQAQPGDTEYSAASELVAVKKYDEAVPALRKFLSDFPKHAKVVHARIRLGEALLGASKPAEALPAYQAALDEKPPADLRTEALVGAGKAHLALNAPDKAVDSLKEASALSSQDEKFGPVANALLGDALYRSEQYALAAVAYARVNNWPTHPEAARSYFMVAESFRVAGNLPEAAITYKNVAEKYWRTTYAPQAAIQAAECYLAMRQFAEAEAQFRLVLTRYTESPLAGRAQLGVGKVAAAQGSYPVARAAYLGAKLAYGHTGIEPEADLRIADTYLAERTYEEAVKKYSSLVDAKDPAIAREARYSLGVTLLKSGDVTGAREAFGRLAEDKTDKNWSQRARLRLADLIAAEGDDEKALANLRSVLLEKPEPAVRDEATFTLGQMLLARKDYKAAEAQLTALLDRSPSFPQAPQAEISLARCRLEQKDALAAAKRMAALLNTELEPELRAAALTVQGRAQIDLKDEKTGAASLEEVLSKHANSPAAADAARSLLAYYKTTDRKDDIQRLEAMIGQKFGGAAAATEGLAQADAKLQAGQFAEAAAAYQKVLETRPERTLRLKARAGLAEAHAALAHRAEAVAALNEIARDEPPGGVLAGAHFRAAMGFLRAGDADQAQAELRASLDAKPEDDIAPSVMLHLAQFQSDRKKPGEAVPLLRELIARYPRASQLPEALYALAWCYVDQGQPEQARPVFLRIAKDHPAHALAADASFRVGEEEYKAGNYAAAAERYRMAFESNTAVADKAGYKLGWSLRQLGQHAEAAKAFSRVAERFPKSEVALECRVRAGEALLELEQDKNALAQFEPVLKLESKTRLERDLQAEARVGTALAYLLKGDFKKAKAAAQPVVENGSGWVAGRAQLVRAEAILLDEGPKAALAEYLRGGVLFSRNDALAAEFQFKSGECYEKLGNLKAARAAWQRVIDQYGGTEWATRSRERLDAKPAARG